MNIEKEIKAIDEFIKRYTYLDTALDEYIKSYMKEIGYISLRKGVEDAFKMNNINDVLFVPGLEDDYPVVCIEYDEASESVWLKCYVADVFDEKEYENNDNYQNDELQYFDTETKLNVLKKIRDFLKNIS